MLNPCQSGRGSIWAVTNRGKPLSTFRYRRTQDLCPCPYPIGPWPCPPVGVSKRHHGIGFLVSGSSFASLYPRGTERTRDVFRFNLWCCHSCSLYQGKKERIDLCGALLVSGQPPKNSLMYWAARAGPLCFSTDGFNSPTRSR